jgi:prophage tail gpP-like protein
MTSFFTDDKLTVEFLDQSGKPTNPIDNWTTFNLQRDFFTPADTFTLVLEDDRAIQLNNQLQAGMALRFSINKVPCMTGFIFKYHLGYSRTGGMQLTISGQDLLGWMAKAICLPTNVGTATTNYHFKPTDTFKYAFETLFNTFAAEVQLPVKLNVKTDDTANLSISTGGTVGNKVNKKSRNLAKSLQSAFQRLSAPHNNETFLAYALRLAKHLGCNIKLASALNVDGSLDVFVMPPTYDRTVNTPFSIYHSFNPSPPNFNTALDGSVEIDMEHQPSVIVMEMATAGNNSYYQGAQKISCINELTGYPRTAGLQLQNPPNNINQAVPNVQQFVNALVNPTGATDKLKVGYNILPPNQALYDTLPSTLIGLQTQLSLPAYMQDNNAHTIDELNFGAAKAMAEAQDKYFTLNYTVQGFSQNGRVWSPNMMVNVYDQTIGQPGKPLDGSFWLQKVNFIKQRNAPGTITQLQLGLPYTHAFTITLDTPTPSSNTGPQYLNNNFKGV